MYTRVTKEQFEIRDGVYIHIPTEAEFAPNPNRGGSMLIYTGGIGARLASGDLFYYEVLKVNIFGRKSAGVVRPESRKPFWQSNTIESSRLNCPNDDQSESQPNCHVPTTASITRFYC